MRPKPAGALICLYLWSFVQVACTRSAVRLDPISTILDAFRSQVEGTGIEGDLALFGEGPPTTALMWIRDASVPTTDAAFDAFASGFVNGIGVQRRTTRASAR